MTTRSSPCRPRCCGGCRSRPRCRRSSTRRSPLNTERDQDAAAVFQKVLGAAEGPRRSARAIRRGLEANEAQRALRHPELLAGRSASTPRSLVARGCAAADTLDCSGCHRAAGFTQDRVGADPFARGGYEYFDPASIGAARVVRGRGTLSSPARTPKSSGRLHERRGESGRAPAEVAAKHTLAKQIVNKTHRKRLHRSTQASTSTLVLCIVRVATRRHDRDRATPGTAARRKSTRPQHVKIGGEEQNRRLDHRSSGKTRREQPPITCEPIAISSSRCAVVRAEGEWRSSARTPRTGIIRESSPSATGRGQGAVLAVDEQDASSTGGDQPVRRRPGFDQ